MGKLGEREKQRMVFFLNKKEELEYNKTCMSCKEKCKQSFRVQIFSCKKYKRSDSKK